MRNHYRNFLNYPYIGACILYVRTSRKQTATDKTLLRDTARKSVLRFALLRFNDFRFPNDITNGFVSWLIYYWQASGKFRGYANEDNLMTLINVWLSIVLQ